MEHVLLKDDISKPIESCRLTHLVRRAYFQENFTEIRHLIFQPALGFSPTAFELREGVHQAQLSRWAARTYMLSARL